MRNIIILFLFILTSQSADAFVKKKAKAAKCAYQVYFTWEGAERKYELEDAYIKARAYGAYGGKKPLKLLKKRASSRAVSCLREKVDISAPIICSGVHNGSKDINTEIKPTLFKGTIQENLKSKYVKIFKLKGGTLKDIYAYLKPIVAGCNIATSGLFKDFEVRCDEIGLNKSFPEKDKEPSFQPMPKKPSFQLMPKKQKRR